MANISSIKLPDGTTYDIKDSNSGYITGMTILSYGSSTWDNFIEAYNANKIVYCRASSNANPASGSQTRLAFMAYVNNATTPTNVEFQYYRSVSSHTVSQQGDQVFVYKLDKTSGWSVTVREASVKVVAGTGLSGTYSNGTMTLTGPTKVSDLTNDSGFITDYTETDPVFKASAAHGITASDITNWNGKQAALVSGANIKTVNGNSLLGSGNISISSSDFIGTDGTAAGTHGLVPAPATTDSGKFLSADGTWAAPPGSGSSISYVTKSENTYTTTSSSSISTIPIGIQSYTATDVLLVDINGLDLIQGTDYTISGTNIVLTTPITTSGTKVHFTALKMTTATTSDYVTLKGEKGDDGHSPVVTASKSGTTTTVYVDGSSIASINDGTNGTHTISYTPIVTGGAQIGTITIDNTSYPLYAPAVVWG